MAARQLSNGSSEGQVLGQSASDLIAFHGAAPVDQAANVAAVATTAATNSTPYGYAQAQANAIVTAVNALLAMAKEKGLMAPDA